MRGHRTLQRDDVRLTDEERFRRGGLRHARGTHRRKGHRTVWAARKQWELQLYNP